MAKTTEKDATSVPELPIRMVECLLQFNYSGIWIGAGETEWEWPDPWRLIAQHNNHNGDEHNCVKAVLPLSMVDSRAQSGQVRILQVLPDLLVKDTTVAAPDRVAKKLIEDDNIATVSAYKEANQPSTLYVEPRSWNSQGIRLPEWDASSEG